MTTIQLAHLRVQGQNIAVFAANGASNTGTSRARALAHLTDAARHQGLRVDKSALAYRQGRRTIYYGAPDLVRYLSNRGVPRWTHVIQG